YRLINDIAHQEAERRKPKVVYVDTVPAIAAGGTYAAFLPNADGSLVQVRASDGVHFTRAGGDRIAGAVLSAMQSTFDLTSWQSATTTTSLAPPPTTSTTGAKRRRK